MRRMVWIYLGRRGALARFTLDLARTLSADRSNIFVVSEYNELASELRETGADVRFAPMFKIGIGALKLWQARTLGRFIGEIVTDARAEAVVELMGHVWSPLIEAAIVKTGALRVAILHDWRPHPGDAFGYATRWLSASALRAHRVVTLSRFVGAQIRDACPSASSKMIELFHPDFDYDVNDLPRSRSPLGVLFMGRLSAYKGLDLFVEGLEYAKQRGALFKPYVCGSGDIAALAKRLEALGASINNYWHADCEIAAALERCDVVAATYHEASQSGVVAAAFGSGRPVIATPVGALPEQVTHMRTGLVSERADGVSVGQILVRLAADPSLAYTLAREVRMDAPQRSMRAFADLLIERCVGVQ